MFSEDIVDKIIVEGKTGPYDSDRCHACRKSRVEIAISVWGRYEGPIYTEGQLYCANVEICQECFMELVESSPASHFKTVFGWQHKVEQEAQKVEQDD